jgi:hypothetical protein
MVFVTEAIIHKNTVVIKLLNTSVAKVAMLSVLGTQVFTVHTNIVKMITFGLYPLQNLLKVGLFVNISWIHESKYVENNSSNKEKVTYDVSSF